MHALMHVCGHVYVCMYVSMLSTQSRAHVLDAAIYPEWKVKLFVPKMLHKSGSANLLKPVGDSN